jgi:hypothetical protein
VAGDAPGLLGQLGLATAPEHSDPEKAVAPRAARAVGVLSGVGAERLDCEGQHVLAREEARKRTPQRKSATPSPL